MNSSSILRRPFRYSFSNATLWLIGINVIVFLLTAINRGLYDLLALSVDGVAGKGYLWQLFTYMFCHSRADIFHIVFNMIGLYIFGTEIERRVGTREFLFFYLLMGLLAGIFSFAVFRLLHINEAVLVGASGALFALLLLFAVFFPDARLLVWGILPVRAPVLVLGYAGIEIVMELFRATGHPMDNVAHLTHLAGFGFAWIYCLIRYGINPWKRFFLK